MIASRLSSAVVARLHDDRTVMNASTVRQLLVRTVASDTDRRSAGEIIEAIPTVFSRANAKQSACGAPTFLPLMSINRV